MSTTQPTTPRPYYYSDFERSLAVFSAALLVVIGLVLGVVNVVSPTSPAGMYAGLAVSAALFGVAFYFVRKSRERI